MTERDSALIEALLDEADATAYLVDGARRLVSAVRRLLARGDAWRRTFGPLPDLDALVGWPEAMEAELLRMEHGEADPDALDALTAVGWAHMDALIARLPPAMDERR